MSDLLTTAPRADRVLARVEWGIRLGWFGPISEEKKAGMVAWVGERWTGEDEASLMALVADRQLKDLYAETREEFALRTGIRIGGARPAKGRRRRS